MKIGSNNYKRYELVDVLVEEPKTVEWVSMNRFVYLLTRWISKILLLHKGTDTNFEFT